VPLPGGLRGVLIAVLFASCGGGGASPSRPSATPAPTPTPTPVAEASPSPTPCPPGVECTTNNPVVRVSLRIYRLWDNKGHIVDPIPKPQKQVLKQPMPVGYQILFDVVGQDANGRNTNGNDGGAGITFLPSDETRCVLEYYGNWQRKCFVEQPGHWEMYVSWAGVDSNSIGFTFVDCANARPPLLCN
jgi:hypothetical protein